MGGNGGNGGGVVFISAETVSVSGTVTASGGGGVTNGQYGGGGGGGAGGSVVLQGNNVSLGTTKVTSSGGALGDSTYAGDGGGGGVGRIAVYTAVSVSGTTTPTYSGSTVGYYSYGVYTSSVISTPNAQSYDNITWDQSLNTYGKISVQTRSGATSDPTDGTWEEWRPYTSGTNYTTLHSADTHTDFTGTNATVAEGDIGRNVDYFEDEDESLVTNITKVTSSTYP
jgi:hypothetical protein